MKNRLTIFAHFDRDNIIDDYVILYLQALKQVSKDIIFISDCNLPETELSKINEICIIAIGTKYGEYDFGSWKRGLEAAKKQNLNIFEYDEIILANDSCYLLSSLTNVFFEMEKRELVDFWGITIGKDQYDHHLQSYFLCFKKNTFKDLEKFLMKVTKLKSKTEIIEKYEVGISKFFLENGYKSDSFFRKKFRSNPMASKSFFKLIKKKIPFIKKELLIFNLRNIKNLYKFMEFVETKELLDAIQKSINRFNPTRQNWYFKRNILDIFFSVKIRGGFKVYRIFGIKIIKLQQK